MTGSDSKVRIAQPRGRLASIVLQQNTLTAAFTRRATRAELMLAGAPKVIGHDSTVNQKILPGTWTLASENAEGRKGPQHTSWKENTSQQMAYLENELKKSLRQNPHPLLSEKAKEELQRNL